MKKAITTMLAIIGAIVVITLTGPISVPLLSVVISVLGVVTLIRWFGDNKKHKK